MKVDIIIKEGSFAKSGLLALEQIANRRRNPQKFPKES